MYTESGPPPLPKLSVCAQVQYTYFSSAVNRIKNGRFADGLQGRVYGECFKQARGLYRWLMVTDLVGGDVCRSRSATTPTLL